MSRFAYDVGQRIIRVAYYLKREYFSKIQDSGNKRVKTGKIVDSLSHSVTRATAVAGMLSNHFPYVFLIAVHSDNNDQA